MRGWARNLRGTVTIRRRYSLNTCLQGLNKCTRGWLPASSDSCNKKFKIFPYDIGLHENISNIKYRYIYI